MGKRFPIRKKEFFAWLRAHAGERIYEGRGSKARCCPLARCAREKGLAGKGSDILVGAYQLYVHARRRRPPISRTWMLPQWSQDFILAVDLAAKTLPVDQATIGEVLPLLRRDGVRP